MKLFHDREMKRKSPNGPRTDPGKILLNIGKLDKFVNLTNSPTTQCRGWPSRTRDQKQGHWSKCKESWASK